MIGEGKRLAVYSTKLEHDTKRMLSLLAQSQKLSHRELINKMLNLYKAENPQEVIKAEQLERLLES